MQKYFIIISFGLLSALISVVSFKYPLFLSNTWLPGLAFGIIFGFLFDILHSETKNKFILWTVFSTLGYFVAYFVTVLFNTYVGLLCFSTTCNSNLFILPLPFIFSGIIGSAFLCFAINKWISRLSKNQVVKTMFMGGLLGFAFELTSLNGTTLSILENLEYLLLSVMAFAVWQIGMGISLNKIISK